MKRPVHLSLTLGLPCVLVVAACASSGGTSGSSASSGPVGIVQIAAYTGDQAFEAQFADSIDYPGLYAVNHAGGVLGHQGPDSTSAATLVPLLNNRRLPMMVTAGEAAYDRSSYAYLWRDVPPDFSGSASAFKSVPDMGAVFFASTAAASCPSPTRQKNGAP
jgi:hypothetical protein